MKLFLYGFQLISRTLKIRNIMIILSRRRSVNWVFGLDWTNMLVTRYNRARAVHSRREWCKTITIPYIWYTGINPQSKYSGQNVYNPAISIMVISLLIDLYVGILVVQKETTLQQLYDILCSFCCAQVPTAITTFQILSLVVKFIKINKPILVPIGNT